MTGKDPLDDVFGAGTPTIIIGPITDWTPDGPCRFSGPHALDNFQEYLASAREGREPVFQGKEDDIKIPVPKWVK